MALHTSQGLSTWSDGMEMEMAPGERGQRIEKGDSKISTALYKTPIQNVH